jgi:hypothetical protein
MPRADRKGTGDTDIGKDGREGRRQQTPTYREGRGIDTERYHHGLGIEVNIANAPDMPNVLI